MLASLAKTTVLCLLSKRLHRGLPAAELSSDRMPVGIYD